MKPAQIGDSIMKPRGIGVMTAACCWILSSALPAQASYWDYGCKGHLGDKDSAPSCECKGHLQHGHKTVCRHLACVRALIAAGKLDDAPTAGKPAPCPHEHVFRADDGEMCCENCSADLS